VSFNGAPILSHPAGMGAVQLSCRIDSTLECLAEYYKCKGTQSLVREMEADHFD
jgi:hypothetical protein